MKPHYPMRKIRRVISIVTYSFTLLLVSPQLVSQTLYSEAELIQSALAFHPEIKAAQSNVEGKKNLEKSGFSLPAPNVYTQSPSGVFYTIGINQNIDFPTVYTNQKKVLRAETTLAENQALLTQQQLIWQVRNTYNYARYTTTQLYHLWKRDSLISSMNDAAERQFAAGEINFMEKSFVNLKYGETHQKFLSAQASNLLAIQELEMLCGLENEADILPYVESELTMLMLEDTSGKYDNAQLSIARSEVEISDQRVKLEKSKAMPGFQVGFLNQVLKDSPVQYRFQAGITLPIWWWQYAGKIKAAKADAQTSKHNQESTAMEFRVTLNHAQSKVASTSVKLQYYLQTGLQQLTELEKASQRFYKEGEIDVTALLRTLDDAMQIRLDYTEAAREFTDAIASLKFINGTN